MQKSAAVNLRALAAFIALMTFFVVFSGDANAADAQVKIANFTFEPPVLTVKVGTTVTWVNDDDIPHLVSERRTLNSAQVHSIPMRRSPRPLKTQARLNISVCCIPT